MTRRNKFLTWMEAMVPWLRLPALIEPHYAPHLNPPLDDCRHSPAGQRIERLWGVMHKWVTHNRHYATFDQFTDAILKFFRKTLPVKWREFRDTVTDNFRIISHNEYKLI